MASPSSPTLTCPECKYVNESERVYCHNCGGKLDRALLPKDDDRRKDSVEKARRRVKKLTNPGSNPLARELKALLKTLAWAAGIAALILIVRAPAGVPEANPNSLPTRIVSSELAEAVDFPQPRSLQFSEDEVNAHLKQSLRAQSKGGIYQFDRAFVNFDPGVCRITMQHSLYGYPIYVGSAYSLAIKNGKLAATNLGGNFGRLSIPPVLMQYGDLAFSKIWTAMQRQREQMDKLRDIRIGHKQIILVTSGGVR